MGGEGHSKALSPFVESADAQRPQLSADVFKLVTSISERLAGIESSQYRLDNRLVNIEASLPIAQPCGSHVKERVSTERINPPEASLPRPHKGVSYLNGSGSPASVNPPEAPLPRPQKGASHTSHLMMLS